MAERELAPLAGGLLADVAKFSGQAAAVYLRDPENVAGLAGAFVLPLAVFRRGRVPFLPLFAVALIGDQLFRAGYRASCDLHDLAAAARDAREN
jgi:hypothetical protein